MIYGKVYNMAVQDTNTPRCKRAVSPTTICCQYLDSQACLHVIFKLMRRYRLETANCICSNMSRLVERGDSEKCVITIEATVAL
jgi:hypothetical protein